MQENFIQDFLSTVEYENIGKHPDLEKITIDQINDPGFIKNKKLQEIIIDIRVRKLFQLFFEEGKIQELNKEVNWLEEEKETLKEEKEEFEKKNDKQFTLINEAKEREKSQYEQYKNEKKQKEEEKIKNEELTKNNNSLTDENLKLILEKATQQGVLDTYKELYNKEAKEKKSLIIAEAKNEERRSNY